MNNRLMKCNYCNAEILEKFKNNKTLLNHISLVPIFIISKKGKKIFSHFEKNKCEIGDYKSDYWRIKKSFSFLKEEEKEIKNDKKDFNKKLLEDFFETNKIDFKRSKSTNSYYVYINDKLIKISDHVIIDNLFSKENLKVNKENEYVLLNDKDYNFSENIGANYWQNQKEYNSCDYVILINFSKKLNLEKIEKNIKGVI